MIPRWVTQPLTLLQGLDDGLFTRQHSKANLTYVGELAAYTSIMAPIARSIKALEGRAANAADVYIFWLAIAASLQKLFSRDGDIDGDSCGGPSYQTNSGKCVISLLPGH